MSSVKGIDEVLCEPLSIPEDLLLGGDDNPIDRLNAEEGLVSFATPFVAHFHFLAHTAKGAFPRHPMSPMRPLIESALHHPILQSLPFPKNVCMSALGRFLAVFFFYPVIRLSAIGRMDTTGNRRPAVATIAATRFVP